MRVPEGEKLAECYRSQGSCQLHGPRSFIANISNLRPGEGLGLLGVGGEG